MRMDIFEDIVDLVLIILICYEAYEYMLSISGRRFWVRNLYLDRDISGFFATTFRKLKEGDPEQFKVATRMDKETFDVLCNLLRSKLSKTSIRTPISPECRLYLTLIYLAHAGSRQFYSLSFKMGLTSVRRITLETCNIIWDELSQIYVSLPNHHEWKKISEDFTNRWNMPNYVGAIDGKHVYITCPANSGSMYYNYKGTYSIILLAVCDANYTFMAVDIGAYGTQSDGGVLKFSAFGKFLSTGKLDLPENSNLPNSDISFPYYFVGDAAFPLKPFLMRPYPGILLDEKKENYNKRLSRARRTIENTFGILTARWRILRSTMNISPDSAETIVKATVVLHNFLKKTCSSYCPDEYVDRYNGDLVIEGLWRKEPLQKVRKVASNNATQNAFHLRDTLREYLFQN